MHFDDNGSLWIAPHLIPIPSHVALVTVPVPHQNWAINHVCCVVMIYTTSYSIYQCCYHLCCSHLAQVHHYIKMLLQ